MAVGTEQISNLARGDTDIASGNISVGANVLAKLRHESDTKLPNLIVGFTLGVKICTSFAATDVHWIIKNAVSLYLMAAAITKVITEQGTKRTLTACECILKDLFEAQKLQDRQVYCGMKSKPSFVWSKS